MSLHYIFFNHVGRLRSGWRLFVFIATFLILSLVIGRTVILALSLLLGTATEEFLKGNWGFIIQALTLFASAFLAGWGCGRVFEGLPMRALGWSAHQGWWRDLLLGSLIGAASLVLATLIATAFGGFHFSFNPQGMSPAIAKTLLVSALIFIPAAAAEEVTFRGYPLQTMTRAHLAWVAIVLTSILFSSAHLGNPNVVPGFTFINTALAGVWLSAAYLRTRSLWLPLGVHWTWNWMMGAVLGLPVSGIENITPAPLLRATDTGPAWLTGGAYGIEGGAACTVALIVSTLFIWRTRRLRATEEMMRLTDQENALASENTVANTLSSSAS